jgi:hypothetical protein
MHHFYDESGDFSFPPDRYDAYTQAVLICPDSKLADIDEWVNAKAAEWAVDELHATSLTDNQIFEICRFIRAQQLPLLVQATDTNGITRETIAAHRLDQAVRVHENAERWKAAGGSAESIERWYDRHVSRIAYVGRVSDSEWVQADLLVNLIHHALNKTIAAFLDDKWRDDFRDFRFIVDAKLAGKLAAGEKYLRDVLLPALGSNPDRFSLIGVIEWRESSPMHPYEEKYGTGDGTVDLRVLFEHGLQYEPSENHPGLQLVDTVAHVARRRILDRENETIRLAFKTIRPLLNTHDGGNLYIVRFAAGGDDADETRFINL